jgi:hypothetical protein
MNKDRRSRIGKMVELLHAAKNKIEALDVESALTEAKEALDEVRNEEQEAFDNMSENLQGGERGDAMQEAVSELESAVSELDEALEMLNMVDKVEEAIAHAESAIG